MAGTPSRAVLVEELGANSFFAGLPELALAELASQASWREYGPGEMIFLEGEPAAGLYVLQGGWLKIVKVSLDGREQVLRYLEPGEAFNALALFADQPNPATAIALEPAGVWLLRRETVLGLLRQRPDFAERLLAAMAGHLVALVKLVEDLSLRSVTARLARRLLEQAEGEVLRRPRWYTQAELAAQLGTVPDVVQRALNSLAAGGVITVERHQILIRDRAALERLAG
ncbi:MAG: Crp/Fnr family transcriptional regulator [Anaerolineales bacterium]|nr:Crp/Fnr family transcriptional regulator [Anaerolineales bacterium]